MAGSLYRQYRPQKFSELIGQDHVARALQNAMAENRLAHAYLFSGTRGTGKTSTARILGAVLNCEKFREGFPSDPKEVEPCGECESCIATRHGKAFDVIELDAASNNGVDDIRELIEKVSYASVAGGTKVYIVDEVHELTGRASNALLKTLEEPPDHVIFILATTNPEKVLPTIRSRTQHFEFVSPSDEELFNHASNILSLENRQLDEEAVRYIVRKGAGSVRDMLSYLDQVLAIEITSYDELQAMNASGDSSTVFELIDAVSQSDVARTMDALHQLSSAGKEPRAIVENIITYARDCLVLSLNPQASVLLSQHNNKNELIEYGKKYGTNFLRYFILTLGKAISDIRSSASLNPLLTVEIALLATMQQRDPDSSDGRYPPLVRNASEQTVGVGVEAVGSSNVTGRKVTSAGAVQTDEQKVKQDPKSRSTLGAIKKESSKTHVSETVSKKISLHDIAASWPKVVSLLSVASRESIGKVQPYSLEGDVLTFSVSPEDLDEVKARFKKDASIIRGFLESLHNTSFRFQVLSRPLSEIQTATASLSDVVKKPVDDEIDIREEQVDTEVLLIESQVHDPIETVVNLFSGEVVSDNS